MESVLFHAFKSYPRATHFRHTERVVGFHAQHLFNTATLFVRMRFSSDNQSLQMGIAARVDVHLFHHFIQTAGITRDGMKSGGTKVGDKLNLPLGIAGSSRNSQHTQTFGTILEAQSSGKHTVAGRVLKNISLTQSHHIQTARHGIGPFFQIVLCVQNHGRSSCGATGRMKTDYLFQRHGRKPERIMVAQILFGSERNFL